VPLPGYFYVVFHVATYQQSVTYVSRPKKGEMTPIPETYSYPGLSFYVDGLAARMLDEGFTDLERIKAEHQQILAKLDNIIDATALRQPTINERCVLPRLENPLYHNHLVTENSDRNDARCTRPFGICLADEFRICVPTDANVVDCAVRIPWDFVEHHALRWSPGFVLRELSSEQNSQALRKKGAE
jgi:hypothetical protein